MVTVRPRYKSQACSRPLTQIHTPLPLNRGYGGIVRCSSVGYENKTWNGIFGATVFVVLCFACYLHLAAHIIRWTPSSCLERKHTRHVDLDSHITDDSHKLLRNNWLCDITSEQPWNLVRRLFHLSLRATQVGPSKHRRRQLRAKIV